MLPATRFSCTFSCRLRRMSVSLGSKSNIGRNDALVRKVVIDLGEALPYNEKEMDITFIMRKMWERPTATLHSNPGQHV
jgi:hypothetical protein